MTAATMTKTEPRWLTCPETAELIRRVLKDRFPHTKFSVRSSSFSMGTAIDVSWTDGPVEHEVDAITSGYAYSGFDGMVDYSFSMQHYLLPDGTVQLASSEGSECTGGVVPAVRATVVPINGERVHLGAKYVHAHREYSPEFRRRIERLIETLAGEAFDSNKRMRIYWNERLEEDYGSTLVWRVGETLQHGIPAGD